MITTHDGLPVAWVSLHFSDRASSRFPFLSTFFYRFLPQDVATDSRSDPKMVMIRINFKCFIKVYITSRLCPDGDISVLYDQRNGLRPFLPVQLPATFDKNKNVWVTEYCNFTEHCNFTFGMRVLCYSRGRDVGGIWGVKSERFTFVWGLPNAPV